MHSTVWRFLCLFFVLATLSCTEAAPSPNKENVPSTKVEQLVRVYPINEEQYEKLLELTNGKNVISEARLTSAGFASVRNSLDNGWNSLLRIMGLTTTSRAEVAKIDIDGQPLCVMKRSMDEPDSINAEAKSATDESSVINCIVVLKKDSTLETEAAGSANPSFAPYWYHENNAPVATAQQPQAMDSAADTAAPADIEDELRQTTLTTTPAPKVNRMRSKPKSKANPKTKSKPKTQRRKTASNAEASRQYSYPYAPSSTPYSPQYGAASPYGVGSPFGAASSFGGASPYGVGSPYAGANPFGGPSPFGGVNPYEGFSQNSYGSSFPYGGLNQNSYASSLPYDPYSQLSAYSPNPYSGVPPPPPPPPPFSFPTSLYSEETDYHGDEEDHEYEAYETEEDSGESIEHVYED